MSRVPNSRKETKRPKEDGKRKSRVRGATDLPKSITVESTFLLSPQWFDLLEDETAAKTIETHFHELLAELDGWTLDITGITEPKFAAELNFIVDEINDVDRRVVEANNPWGAFFDEYVALRVKSIWSSPSALANFNRERGVRDDDEVVARAASNICDTIVCRILVLMNIYLPGSSRCHYAYSNTDLDFASLGCVSSFQDSCTLLVKSGISPIPGQNFREIVEWSKAVKGFWIGTPETNVGRALNFFSHAHHRTHQLNTLADISWIVGALEALLTESNQEIRSKVSRRALLICPELGTLTSPRELGRLYDFRSKFLHGGIKIPNHFQGDWVSEWYGFEFSVAFNLASAVLIKCVQQIAARGWTEVSYVDDVTGSP